MSFTKVAVLGLGKVGHLAAELLSESGFEVTGVDARPVKAAFATKVVDLQDAAGVLMELNNCRKTFPSHYIRLMAFDSTRGVESIAMSFIVNRPANEPGFGLVRQEVDGRSIRYTVHSYATDKPEAERH